MLDRTSHEAPGLQKARAIRLAILAMGGEGGGVLADWIVDLGEANGFVAQTTSVPGVAQRTGATNYYVELFPKMGARANAPAPVLGLTPIAGDVDIVIASELMEAGRAVQRGLVTPDRTTFIVSTNRVYSMTERIAMAESEAAGAPKKPLVEHVEGVGAVYNDPQTTNRLAERLKQVMGDSNVVIARPIMASDDFAEYRFAGVPSVMLELGAVNPEKYAEAIRLFEQALALDPQSVEAQSRLATQLIARVLDELTDTAAADIASAKELIDQALAASPSDRDAHFAKGQLLRVQRMLGQPSKDRNGAPPRLPPRDSQPWILLWLLGVGFSLWRAVFQASSSSMICGRPFPT